MANSGWVTDVIEDLCKIKRHQVRAGKGLDFDAAWKQALTLNPPRGGAREIEATTLEEAAQLGESTVAFTRRVCRDAYLDLNPILRNLRILWDSSGPDEAESYPAVLPRGRSRQAA